VFFQILLAEFAIAQEMALHQQCCLVSLLAVLDFAGVFRAGSIRQVQEPQAGFSSAVVGW
jgi:hypothetical protein